jgi:transcriptional antiterminator RfaH
MAMQYARLHANVSAASPPPKSWIVISTHPHREHIALENLERQRFEGYCPMVPRRRSHARRVEMVLRPLFPNYLFVRAGPKLGRWQSILSTYGVRTVVRAGEALSFLDDGFIVSLKAREVDGAIVRPASPYQVGQEVRIATRSFDSVIAKIIEMDEKDRIVVLIDMLGRSTKLTLRSDLISAA